MGSSKVVCHPHSCLQCLELIEGRSCTSLLSSANNSFLAGREVVKTILALDEGLMNGNRRALQSLAFHSTLLRRFRELHPANYQHYVLPELEMSNFPRPSTPRPRLEPWKAPQTLDQASRGPESGLLPCLWDAVGLFSPAAKGSLSAEQQLELRVYCLNLILSFLLGDLMDGDQWYWISDAGDEAITQAFISMDLNGVASNDNLLGLITVLCQIAHWRDGWDIATHPAVAPLLVRALQLSSQIKTGFEAFYMGKGEDSGATEASQRVLWLLAYINDHQENWGNIDASLACGVVREWDRMVHQSRGPATVLEHLKEHWTLLRWLAESVLDDPSLATRLGDHGIQTLFLHLEIRRNTNAARSPRPLSSDGTTTLSTRSEDLIRMLYGVLYLTTRAAISLQTRGSSEGAVSNTPLVTEEECRVLSTYLQDFVLARSETDLPGKEILLERSCLLLDAFYRQLPNLAMLVLDPALEEMVEKLSGVGNEGTKLCLNRAKRAYQEAHILRDKQMAQSLETGWAKFGGLRDICTGDRRLF